MIAPSTKILKRPEVLLAARRGRRLHPVNVEIDLSDRCNIECRYCDFAHWRGDTVMPLTLADGIFGQLATFGVEAVTFTGGGEPTTNPEFCNIAESAARWGFALGVYTNGVEAAPLLGVSHRFTWIYVSLDVATPSEYLEMKGKSYFNRVVGTVESLVKFRGVYRPAIGLGFLLKGDDIGHIPAMVNTARSLGVDYAQFRPAVGMDDYSWVPGALDFLSRYDADPLVIIHWARFREMVSFHRSYSVCRGSALVPCIGADGRMWVCPNTRGERLLGDLQEAAFRTVWARRGEQLVGDDCRDACRNHALNETLELVCRQPSSHDCFV